MGFLSRAKEGFESAAGRVGPDLSQWAAARGLTFADEAPLLGIAFEQRWTRRSNGCFGKFPDGHYGALAHEFSLGSSDPDDGDSNKRFTRTATRVPEAVGSLKRFHLSNKWRLRNLTATAYDEQLDVGALGGPDGWTMTAATSADHAALARLLQGGFGEALRRYEAPAELTFTFGTLELTRDRAFLDGADLELQVQALCAMAGELRALAGPTQPWETALPQPFWLDEAAPEGPTVRKVGRMTMVTRTDRLARQETEAFDCPPSAELRARFFELQGESALEDPLAYHAAFPHLPVPGHAVCVYRMAGPGTTARIALYNEGRMERGATAVLMPIKADTPDHPAPITMELGGALSVAVKDGIMAAWMHRDGPARRRAGHTGRQ